ncbi:hypothetical protein CEXT_272641 [Caerostris extrusa]|uniref:Uncharacterized protein n=1 Tax=Caerostris extrusa TaxID=172846 RepID=A0AAV4STT5_CAEEX|nr:hypothetical protein CEXT_272641 [Caerostris extrusa]
MRFQKTRPLHHLLKDPLQHLLQAGSEGLNSSKERQLAQKIILCWRQKPTAVFAERAASTPIDRLPVMKWNVLREFHDPPSYLVLHEEEEEKKKLGACDSNVCGMMIKKSG